MASPFKNIKSCMKTLGEIGINRPCKKARLWAGHQVWTLDRVTGHGYREWTRGMDMGHGHQAWTTSMDAGHGQQAWAWTQGMVRNTEHGHGQQTWTWIWIKGIHMDIVMNRRWTQHGHEQGDRHGHERGSSGVQKPT
jgi:hypothetical protein